MNMLSAWSNEGTLGPDLLLEQGSGLGHVCGEARSWCLSQCLYNLTALEGTRRAADRCGLIRLIHVLVPRLWPQILFLGTLLWEFHVA